MAVWSAYELSRAGYSGSQIAALRNQGKVVDYAHGPKWFSERGLSGGYGGLHDYSKLSGSGSYGSSRGGSASSGSGSALGSYFDQLQQITSSNNAWSASQAQKQMDFQAQQGVLARQFNHDEAELSRLWQERMSNTAHQREIKDLQAAGLNPILSVMGGSGAPVTSGATASGYSPPSGAKGDTDTSLGPALVSLIGASMSAQASMANAALSARTQESVADKYNAMSELVARIQQETTLSSASISAAASRYAADTGAAASKVAASIHAAAAKYGYDVGAMTQRQIAAFNAQVNKDLQAAGFQHEFDVKEAFPQTMPGLLSSLFGESVLGEGRGLGSLSDIWSKIGDALSGSAKSSSVGGGGGRGGRGR